LLAGLPDSYEDLNMSLVSLPDDKFTSTEVKRVLLTEYDRRKTRQDVEVSISKEALQTKKSDRKTSKVIHHNSNGNEQKSVVCYRCKKVGHISKNCRVKVDKVSKKKDTASWKDYSAFLVSLNNVDVEETWILDSGCTHHICKRKEWFFKFKSMSSEIINTAADPDKQGGSVLRAEGIGDVALRTYVGNQKRESFYATFITSPMYAKT